MMLPCPECWGLEKRNGVCNEENPGSTTYYLGVSAQVNLSVTLLDLVKWECLTTLPALGVVRSDCLSHATYMLATTVVVSIRHNV